ncbi:MAG: GMC family oxidoreductase [Candidatus Limnocylindrales bacterium]
MRGASRREPHDFAPRSDDDSGGWPLDFDQLRPHLDAAHATWTGTRADYDATHWSDEAHPLLTFAGDALHTRIAYHGASDVWSVAHRDLLERAENVAVVPDHTVVTLKTGASGRVASAVVVDREGQRSTVRASSFVLTAGGIENVQLLLASDLTAPGARGNVADQIGRYITDHPEFRLGTIVLDDPGVVDRLGLYDIRIVGDALVSGFLTIDPARRQADRLRNMSVVLVPQRDGFGSPAERALKSLAGLRRGQVPAGILGSVKTVATSVGDDIAVLRHYRRDYEEYRGGWSRPEVDRRPYTRIELWAATEQSPDPDNRVTLLPGRDPYGRQRPHLRWRWSEADRASARRSMAIVAGEFERTGLGTFVPWAVLEGPDRPFYAGIHHPMGGTRMHADPTRGAVDVDCRVHGSDNLYVAGSSVFTTGLGYANPTLTLLALADRLGRHLQSRIPNAG